MRKLEVAVAVLVALGAMAPASGSSAAWDVVADFAIAPAQANPAPDATGNPDVWWYMQSASLAHDPGGYSLLSTFRTPGGAFTGSQSWTPPSSVLPTVGINASGSTIADGVGFVWPAGTIDVHPTTTHNVVVGWRSPVTGRVAVSGTVADLDTGCCTGIVWSLDRGATTLASGGYADGGYDTFSLPDVAVSSAEFLYVVVGPNGPDGKDSTRLDLRIELSELAVPIDVKPDSDRNTVNTRSKGTIPVAILSSASLDAADVDAESLTFGRTGEEGSLARRGNGSPNCASGDADGDGDDDLICHFSASAAGFGAGDTSARLRGSLIDGTAIAGSDAVEVVR